MFGVGKDSAKSRTKSNTAAIIVGLLIVLGLVIISVLIKQNSPGDDSASPSLSDSSSLDEMLAKIQENYDGDLYSGDGPKIFADYVYDEAYDGNITFGTAYGYFEEMGTRLSGPETKLYFCSAYAETRYKLDRDIEDTVATFQKCQPESEVDTQRLSEYYAVLRSLYETAGDTTQAARYDELAREAAPEVVPSIDASGLEEGQ